MTAIARALSRATQQLSATSDTPRLDAEVLMAHALGIERDSLLLSDQPHMVPAVYHSLIDRRKAGEPVAYITGKRAFWNIELEVGPGALVPRPDSETLMVAAVEHFAGTPGPKRVLDLGTGPGTLLLAALGGEASFEDGSGGYGYNAVYVGGRPGDAYSPIALLDLQVPGRTVMFATTGLSKEDGIQEYPFAEPHFAPTENGGRAWDLQPSVHFRADGKAIVAWCDGRQNMCVRRAPSD